MSLKNRVRLALAAIALTLGGVGTQALASPPARGYGNCRDCSCSPYQTGNGNTCYRRTCGHSYSRHY